MSDIRFMREMEADRQAAIEDKNMRTTHGSYNLWQAGTRWFEREAFNLEVEIEGTWDSPKKINRKTLYTVISKECADALLLKVGTEEPVTLYGEEPDTMEQSGWSIEVEWTKPEQRWNEATVRQA